MIHGNASMLLLGEGSEATESYNIYANRHKNLLNILVNRLFQIDMSGDDGGGTQRSRLDSASTKDPYNPTIQLSNYSTIQQLLAQDAKASDKYL